MKHVLCWMEDILMQMVIENGIIFVTSKALDNNTNKRNRRLAVSQPLLAPLNLSSLFRNYSKCHEC